MIGHGVKHSPLKTNHQGRTNHKRPEHACQIDGAVCTRVRVIQSLVNFTDSSDHVTM